MKRTGQQNETWAPVVGYEGLYEISTLGRIRSLSRRRSGRTHNSKGEFFFYTTPKLLTPKLGSAGYMQVGLSKNGKAKTCHMHRMMAEAFIQNTNNYAQVNHIDGNKANFALENLEWCTPSQNGKHAYNVLGRIPATRGKVGKDAHSSRAVVQKTLSGDVVAVWGSGMDAVRAGFDSGRICRCCKGESRTHKGYRWEYAE